MKFNKIKKYLLKLKLKLILIASLVISVVVHAGVHMVLLRHHPGNDFCAWDQRFIYDSKNDNFHYISSKYTTAKVDTTVIMKDPTKDLKPDIWYVDTDYDNRPITAENLEGGSNSWAGSVSTYTNMPDLHTYYFESQDEVRGDPKYYCIFVGCIDSSDSSGVMVKSPSVDIMNHFSCKNDSISNYRLFRYI